MILLLYIDLSGIDIVHFQFKTVPFILVFLCTNVLHLFTFIGAAAVVVAGMRFTLGIKHAQQNQTTPDKEMSRGKKIVNVF